MTHKDAYLVQSVTIHSDPFEYYMHMRTMSETQMEDESESGEIRVSLSITFAKFLLSSQIQRSPRRPTIISLYFVSLLCTYHSFVYPYSPPQSLSALGERFASTSEIHLKKLGQAAKYVVSSYSLSICAHCLIPRHVGFAWIIVSHRIQARDFAQEHTEGVPEHYID